MSENIQPIDTEPGTTAAASNGKAGRIQLWAFDIRRSRGGPIGIVRCWLRILFIMSHEFTETAVTLRASALTYAIILSMVPMLAMSTAILKGLGSDNQLRIAAYRLIDQLETAPETTKPDGSQVTNSSSATTNATVPGQNKNLSALNSEQQPAQPASATQKDQDKQSMTAHLRDAVDTIFNYVDQTNFAALGAFGIVGLLLTVILVLSSIEEAMNAIWHSKQGRSILRKTMDYLALLILLPISINVALAGDTVLESPAIMAHLHTIIPSAWAVQMLLKLLPFFFVVVSLMVMYLFFPNVKVKTHAALVGAVFAALFWFLVQRLYIILQVGVAKYNAIYGSFATVPLFLIWVQLGWTFILLGALLAHAVQNRNQYHLPGADGSPQRRLQLAFDILDTAYSDFANQAVTTLDRLLKTLPAERPGDLLAMADQLTQGGLLRRIEDQESAFIPAVPSEKLEAQKVVRLIFGNENLPSTGGHFAGNVVEAAASAIPVEAFPVSAQRQTETTAMTNPEEEP